MGHYKYHTPHTSHHRREGVVKQLAIAVALAAAATPIIASTLSEKPPKHNQVYFSESLGNCPLVRMYGSNHSEIRALRAIRDGEVDSGLIGPLLVSAYTVCGGEEILDYIETNHPSLVPGVQRIIEGATDLCYGN